MPWILWVSWLWLCNASSWAILVCVDCGSGWFRLHLGFADFPDLVVVMYLAMIAVLPGGCVGLFCLIFWRFPVFPGCVWVGIIYLFGWFSGFCDLGWLLVGLLVFCIFCFCRCSGCWGLLVLVVCFGCLCLWGFGGFGVGLVDFWVFWFVGLLDRFWI